MNIGCGTDGVSCSACRTGTNGSIVSRAAFRTSLLRHFSPKIELNHCCIKEKRDGPKTATLSKLNITLKLQSCDLLSCTGNFNVVKVGLAFVNGSSEPDLEVSVIVGA